MAATPTTCPNCGAGLPAPPAQQPGDALTCPRCAASIVAAEAADEFTPDRPAPDARAERSYRNSPLRYAVLGVLVLVMCVLGYMLYEKKQKQKEDEARNDAPPEEPRAVMPKIVAAPPGGPVVAVAPLAGPGGAPKQGRPPAGGNPNAGEMSKRLVGVWESGKGGDGRTVEYRADGSFTFTTGSEPPKKTAGMWKAEGVDWVTGRTGQSAWLHLEWVADGRTRQGDVIFRADGQLQHPLLDRTAEGGDATATFTKK